MRMPEDTHNRTAFDPSKPVVKVTAVEIPVNDLLDIRTEKAILFFKPLLIEEQCSSYIDAFSQAISPSMPFQGYET
jgi:hypothetical protein